MRINPQVLLEKRYVAPGCFYYTAAIICMKVIILVCCYLWKQNKKEKKSTSSGNREHSHHRNNAHVKCILVTSSVLDLVCRVLFSLF